MSLKDRIDNMEKTLMSHGRILADIIDVVNRQESSFAKFVSQSNEKAIVDASNVLPVLPVPSLVDVQEVTQEVTQETAVVLSAPVVKEMASVNPVSIATIAAVASEDDNDEPVATNTNDELEISETDEEDVKPKPKPVAKTATKKKPVAKKTVRK